MPWIEEVVVVVDFAEPEAAGSVQGTAVCPAVAESFHSEQANVEYSHSSSRRLSALAVACPSAPSKRRA